MKYYRAIIERTIQEEIVLMARSEEHAINMIDEGFYDVEEGTESMEILEINREKI